MLVIVHAEQSRPGPLQAQISIRQDFSDPAVAMICDVGLLEGIALETWELYRESKPGHKRAYQ